MSNKTLASEIRDIDTNREQKILDSAQVISPVINVKIPYKIGTSAEDKPRPVVEVNIDDLQFRRENGRISSYIISSLNSGGRNFEDSEYSKEMDEELGNILYQTDPEKTEDLMSQLKDIGQQEHGVITCDGIIVNGNRRRCALQRLYKKERNEKYKYMKVVILPGKLNKGKKDDVRLDDTEPPSNLDLIRLEERYQYADPCEAQYRPLNMAIDVRNKREFSSIEDIVGNLPGYNSLSRNDKKFKDKVKEYNKAQDVLNIIDEYLVFIGEESNYTKYIKHNSKDEMSWDVVNQLNKQVWQHLGNNKKMNKKKFNPLDTNKFKKFCFHVLHTRKYGGRIYDITGKLFELWNGEYKKDMREIAEMPSISEIKSTVLDTQQDESLEDKDIKDQINKIIGDQNAKIQSKIQAGKKELERQVELFKHDKAIAEMITTVTSEKELKQSLPEGVDVKYIKDQLEVLKDRINDLTKFYTADKYHSQKKIKNLSKRFPDRSNTSKNK